MDHHESPYPIWPIYVTIAALSTYMSCVFFFSVFFCDFRKGPSDPSSVQGVCQETRDSLGDAAENLADLWATRADILMNLGGLKRASNVPCQEALSISPYICMYIL